MSGRRTRSRALLALLAAAALPACGGTTGTLEPDGDELILKISHFRSFENPQNKRPEPTYKVVLSESWKDRIGEGAREPFPKAAPTNIYRGSAPDAKMRHYLGKLREYGLDLLSGRDPDSFNPQELNRLALHPVEAQFTRVITVGTDKSAKAYYYREQQGSKAQIEAFFRCEAFVISIMNGHTVKAGTRSDPVFQKNP